MDIQGYRDRKKAGKIEIKDLGATVMVFQHNFSPIDGSRLNDTFTELNPAGLRIDLENLTAQIAALEGTREDLKELIADVEATIEARKNKPEKSN